MSNEPVIKRGKKYALLLVVAEYEKYEWQERYLCLLDELDNTELTLKALAFAHPEFAKSGVVISTAYGKCLKIKDAVVWFSSRRLRYSEAKTLLDLKVLPFVTLKDHCKA